MIKLFCGILLVASGFMAFIKGTELSSYVWAIICFVIVAVDVIYKKNLSVFICVVLLAVVWVPVVLYLDSRKRKQREKQERKEIERRAWKERECIFPWWYL